MDVLFRNEFGDFWIDPETGNLCVGSPVLKDPLPLDTSYLNHPCEINLDWSILDNTEDDVQKTEGHAEFTIFDDDEDDAIHIQIDPAFAWSKDDVWELIGELLYRVGEIDEDGNVAGHNAEKPLYVIECPGPISDEQVAIIKRNVEITLNKANIDAVPIILADGIKAYFDRVRR